MTEETSEVERLKAAVEAIAFGILAYEEPLQIVGQKRVVQICVVCRGPKGKGHHSECAIGKLVDPELKPVLVPLEG